MGGSQRPQAHSALPPSCWYVISPYLQLLKQEVPDDCFTSQAVHTPFLPSCPLLAGEGGPEEGPGGWGSVLNQAARWLSTHIPWLARLTESAVWTR